MKRLWLAVVIAAGLDLAACASRGLVTSKRTDLYTPEERHELIRRAQVWEATDVPSMDMKAGPRGHGAFASDDVVKCRYIAKEMTGHSPKFTCVIPPDDELKVK